MKRDKNMKNNKMTAARALNLFSQGFHCSQVVFAYAAEELSLDPDTANRISAGFGGGLFLWNVCGCVSGAVMALGFAYGHDKPNDTEVSAEMKAKTLEFQRRFAEENGSVICRELIKYDFGIPGDIEKARESGIMATLCPRLAESACAILDDML
jgi:C_GCAxxG_C_C family probable redox protein